MRSFRIRKVGSKYVVYSEEGKRLGEYATRAEAVKRLQQVEYFKNKHRVSVLLSFVGNEPPTEFRIFRMGVNHTEKGDFLFDAEAAKSVMGARAEWGVSMPIDLEHLSLEAEPGCADTTARDARGWADLELRPDGLYAVNVKWTADGAARLREKRQRYISPVFESDPETNRILRVINCALTALPATHDAPALIAASAKRFKQARASKDFEEFLGVKC